ncbi:hypothetical protein AVEN_216440-1 [Araneus ventricosus]|uniref:Uncharacterized protein n=1 Tax=Araneus ventricosus TaxID=182803 RepID=A0A4Y2BLE9_ARAVE|nr:hypothetical protein AVEN_216440-1 [Araneus ventricosus]
MKDLPPPKGRGGLVARCRPRNPIPLKIRRVLSLLHTKFYQEGVKHPHTGGSLLRKLGEGGWVPAQVSTSSSDRGSKLRCPFQNSPRVASKWDVNITKLNLTTSKK